MTVERGKYINLIMEYRMETMEEDMQVRVAIEKFIAGALSGCRNLHELFDHEHEHGHNH
ncbi:MAG: hypothetical protein M1332_05825 [Deltaproteobacteria bacterium]|nr:hypothetical protein [Deltaproteobacteria bacterium]